ncbi:MAG: FAD-dependent oxidoreductase, partial [Myxococcota bacterium]
EFVDAVEGWRRKGHLESWKTKLGVYEEGQLRARPPSREERFVGTPTSRALLRGMAEGLDLRQGAEIARLESIAGQRFRLWTAEGEEVGTFARVAVTAPAPQAARLLATSAPELAARVAEVRFLPTWAVLLTLSESVEVPFGGIFVNEGPLSWIARENTKPGRGAVERFVLHASSAWSAEHLEWLPEEVVEVLTAAFRRVIERPSLDPETAAAHRWRFARPAHPLDANYLEDYGGRLLCGGDWTGGGGRVESAWRAGRAMAARWGGA